MEQITFNKKEFRIGFEQSGDTFTEHSDLKQWFLDGENQENWSVQITTEKISKIDKAPAPEYTKLAENITFFHENANNALILEYSVVNEDMKSLGIDPDYPPYFLAYTNPGPEHTQIGMEKFFRISATEVASINYTERFAAKNEDEFLTYYNSKERLDKRTELIKMTFPY